MYLSKKYSSIGPSPTLFINSKFKAMKADGIDVVGFGAGEPDFDTPQNIKDAGIKAINEGKTKYTPASGTIELKEAIVKKLKNENGLDYTVNDIVVSNGAKHSLLNVFGAILNPGDEVIIPAPCWVSYPEMVRLSDGVPVFVNAEEKDFFKVNEEMIEKAKTQRTRAVIINTPCNPTGMCYTKEELRKIVDFCVKNEIYMISDEVYEHFIYGDIEHVSVASFGEDAKRLTITVNAVSKTYGMTGWRIGYTASDPKIAKVMSNVQSHATSNPNSIAQYAATEALLGGVAFVKEKAIEYKSRRDYMVDRINSIDGVSCLKPDGAFYVMMNIEKLVGKKYGDKEITDADSFSGLFLEKALVAVVPGTGFGAKYHVRWSYVTTKENIVKGMDRLEKFVSELK